MNHDKFIVPHDKKISLKDYDTSYMGDFHQRKEAKEKLLNDIEKLAELQDVLYASDIYGILIILQAMDAAGKDGIIKHVMSGVNPQGCQVFSFKAPSAEDLDHDYLWRCFKSLPERGRIGIFNRSYYEEVLIVRVHPDILNKQKIPPYKNLDDLWKRRYDEINSFERYLVKNGIIVLKFFLNISKDEQKKRFLNRINRQDKNWKFSMSDAKERKYWDEYQKSFTEMFNNTSTKWAPWYIIPSDYKWFACVAVSDVLVSKLKDLDLKYPQATEEHRIELLKAKEWLESEEE